VDFGEGMRVQSYFYEDGMCTRMSNVLTIFAIINIVSRIIVSRSSTIIIISSSRSTISSIIISTISTSSISLCSLLFILAFRFLCFSCSKPFIIGGSGGSKKGECMWIQECLQ
jgi:hypothetical protein